MTAGGSRLGRWVGLAEFWATMAAIAGLILWPKVVGAVWAMVTWTQEEKDACTAVAGCVVNIVPGGVVPVWWAIAWVAVIIAGIVLCWSPDRWWSSRGRGAFEFIADSSPRWLRAHAAVAALVSLLLLLPGRGITTTWAFEYAIPMTLGIAAVGLATLSIRHARRILPAATFRRLVGDALLVDRAERQLARKSRAKTPSASAGEGDA